jgi:Domain of unknown function (DUF4249)
MKPIFLITAMLILIMFSCEETINPTLQQASPVYVVDAFITNKLDTQVIDLTYSQPYFQQEIPPGVSGAIVTVTDQDGNVVLFPENPNQKGAYIWIPSGVGFGKVGDTYTLSIQVNGESFLASAKMGRVPKIDSITFKMNSPTSQNKNFYRGQFWATDPVGPGDTYWIKTYKNGILLDKPSEINVAYDAALSKGSNFDGLTFIQPIRNGINPDDTDSNDKPISPYEPGDSVYVEINSLTEASFDFLNEVIVQTNRPGGFSELFARPLGNVSSNIVNQNPKGTTVQGFFNVASVSGLGKRFVE